MTPEQIALEHGLCTCDPIYSSRGLTAPDCPWHAYEVEAAMEAYAKQQTEELEKEAESLKEENERLRAEVVDCWRYVLPAKGRTEQASDPSVLEQEIARLKALCIQQYDDMLNNCRALGVKEDTIKPFREQFIKNNKL
jgi:hypothetical protein